MATKRSARRTSALSGQTPVNTQAVPAAQPTPTPAAEAPAASTPSGGEGASKLTRPKMTYYADSDQSGRIRAAYFAGRDKYRWRNMIDMQLHGVMGLVEDLEREFNGGKHFELMPPGTGPVGRPLE